MISCPVPPPDVAQMRALLMTVDCNSRLFAEAGFRALSDQGGFFPAALTALLTIYVALLGYRLLFGIGGARVAEGPLTALKIGAIMALTLNWATFQTLVFDVAYKAPVELARTVGGPMGPRDGDLVGAAQADYDELIADARAIAKQAAQRTTTGTQQGGEVNAANQLFDAAQTLFMASVGVLAIALIAIGVLSALGPIFIALFLFENTRGLFAGWMRALVTAAIVPVVGWAIITLMIVALRPGLETLAADRVAGEIGLDTVTAVVAIISVFAIAQLVLAGAAALIGSGFRFRRAATVRVIDRGGARVTATMQAAPPAVAATRSQSLAEALRRPAPVAPGVRETYSYSSAGGAGGTNVRVDIAQAPSTRATRLGELYRRPAYRGRRAGAA
ncbi:MAG: type IV secretion system protein [Sphingomonadaceae bacterium]|nr:type IV secretion system protein [Sphingomonadaceae bacterium]